MKYGDDKKSPIKVGDFILIDKNGFDKNELNPWYEVVKSKDFPNGINFDEGLVSTKKVGRKSKVYVWQLIWILQIVPGELEEELPKYLSLIRSNFDSDMNLLPWSAGPYDIRGDPYLNRDFCKIQNRARITGPVEKTTETSDTPVMENDEKIKTDIIHISADDTSFEVISNSNSSFDVISESNTDLDVSGNTEFESCEEPETQLEAETLENIKYIQIEDELKIC